MNGTQICNKCLINKSLDEFNSSDIKARRYTCKICKRKQRQEWKRQRLSTIDYSLYHACTNCLVTKNAKNFYDSYLANSTYICRPCADIMTNK